MQILLIRHENFSQKVLSNLWNLLKFISYQNQISWKIDIFINSCELVRADQHELHHRSICEQEYKENEIWFHSDNSESIQQDDAFYFYIKESFHERFNTSCCSWNSENLWAVYKNYNRLKIFICDRILKWSYAYFKNFTRYEYCISFADRWSNRMF